MGIREDVLKLADELDRSILEDSCETCVASGTESCIHFLKCVDSVHVETSKRLRAIADKDADDVTTMSAYDLLPEEDRKAIAWVREHGGLDAVKASAHQGAMGHGCLLKVAEMLGTSIYDGSDNADALLDKLRKRLMPDGMEWPRFEDSEPVRFGDEFVDCNGDTGVVYTVKFGKHAFRVRSIEGNVIAFEHGDRVKRPAPKVVDADGVEIKPGDTVYWMGCEHHVSLVDEPRGKVRIVYENAGRWVEPGALTHEQPDTWERLEADARMEAFDYVAQRKPEVGEDTSISEDKCIDLVRRCCALAERGE